MERWFQEMERGHLDAAWDSFVARYRRLIFATIAARGWHGALRRCAPTRDARFSTWLVVVIRNLAIDWYRSREGRTRLGSFGAFLRELVEVYRVMSGPGAGRLPRELTVAPPESQQHPDDESAMEMRRILADAMAGLGAAERLAVQLYIVEELPAVEVARLTGVANAKTPVLTASIRMDVTTAHTL